MQKEPEIIKIIFRCGEVITIVCDDLCTSVKWPYTNFIDFTLKGKTVITINPFDVVAMNYRTEVL